METADHQADVIQRHRDHDEAAEDIDRLQPGGRSGTVHGCRLYAGAVFASAGSSSPGDPPQER
jgi:hypothetical protein